eukprot:1160170-Pelagomonas_calceolata.AAC.2
MCIFNISCTFVVVREAKVPSRALLNFCVRGTGAVTCASVHAIVHEAAAPLCSLKLWCYRNLVKPKPWWRTLGMAVRKVLPLRALAAPFQRALRGALWELQRNKSSEALYGCWIGALKQVLLMGAPWVL